MHKKNQIQSELKSLEENKKEISLELEKISGLSLSEAKEKLIQTAEEEIQFEVAKKYRF